MCFAAGFGVTHAEDLLRKAIERVSPTGMRLPPLDFRVLTLMLMFGLIAVVLLFFGAGSSLFMAALGLGLGYFTPRIIAFIQDPDSVMGPSVWDEGNAAVEEGPAMPDTRMDLDMETLRAVRNELDNDKKS